ncbi:MAG: primosomal protein [Pelagibacteraceae bacterium TMED287]|nr:MAG: primosomal protein [Pelagibacteraceae bacterium TMED287]
MYPMDILQKEVAQYNRNFTEQKRAFGELGHPDGPTVNLERVSHMITALYKDGKNFIGEAKIMDTPMGKIVKSLMDEGAKLGVSSRGLGSLEQKNGASYVKDDFYLATAADIVADPSAPNAFVEGIMEGKEWVWDNGIIKEAEIAEMKRNVEKAIRSREAKVLSLEFAKFLKKL